MSVCQCEFCRYFCNCSVSPFSSSPNMIDQIIQQFLDANSPPVTVSPPAHRLRASWNIITKSSLVEWISPFIEISVSSANAKLTKLTSVSIAAGSNSTLYLFLSIIMISFVDINAHNVGPTPLSWSLPCYGIGALSFACSDLLSPVFMWCSVSCNTLNIARAISPVTPNSWVQV